MSAGSSKGGGLPKHRSLPNDNLSTDLGELHQRRMDPGAGSMAGRSALKPPRCVSPIRNGGAEGCNPLRLPFTYHALIAAHSEVTRAP